MRHLPIRKTEAGFTLIEILVVILVIGILAAIAVPVFLNQRQKANDSAVVSDLKNAGMLIEAQGKFSGTIPAEFKSSKGVKLAAMRTSDRDNKVAASSFVDGNDPNWHTFLHNGSAATTSIITNPSDGYKGMNYRRILVTNGPSGSVSGQFVYYDTPEIVMKGESYTVGVAMRHNYTGCRTMHIEFKGATVEFAGGISSKQVCFTANQWGYYEFTGTSNGDNVNRIVMSLYASNMATGQNFDTTGAVIVKGTSINSEAALDTSGNDFCILGRHENNAGKLWHYSSLDGGVSEGGC